MDATDTDTPSVPVALRPARLPASLRDRHPFVPDRYIQGGVIPDDAPVYLLRYPDERTESLCRREWRSDGARHVTDAELNLRRVEAVPLALPEGARALMLNRIDELADLRAHLRSSGRALSESEQHDFLQATIEVAQFDAEAAVLHPPLAKALADAEYYEERTRLAAAAFWLDGITTAGDRDYERVRVLVRDALGRVTAEEREGIPLTDRYAIGWQAMITRRPSAEQKKSSD